MRIPPLHRRKGYQRFFAGIIIGFILGWFFFLLSFGGLQEFYISEIEKRDQKIKSLNQDYEHYRSEYEEKNKENQKKLRIQEIKITFLNREKVGLKGLSLIELENSVKQDLHDVLTKDIESVGENSELLVKSLENKEHWIGKEKYKVKVYQMQLYTTLRLKLQVERVN